MPISEGRGRGVKEKTESEDDIRKRRSETFDALRKFFFEIKEEEVDHSRIYEQVDSLKYENGMSEIKLRNEISHRAKALALQALSNEDICSRFTPAASSHLRSLIIDESWEEALLYFRIAEQTPKELQEEDWKCIKDLLSDFTCEIYQVKTPPKTGKNLLANTRAFNIHGLMCQWLESQLWLTNSGDFQVASAWKGEMREVLVSVVTEGLIINPALEKGQKITLTQEKDQNNNGVKCQYGIEVIDKEITNAALAMTQCYLIRSLSPSGYLRLIKPVSPELSLPDKEKLLTCLLDSGSGKTTMASLFLRLTEKYANDSQKLDQKKFEEIMTWLEGSVERINGIASDQQLYQDNGVGVNKCKMAHDNFALFQHKMLQRVIDGSSTWEEAKMRLNLCFEALGRNSMYAFFEHEEKKLEGYIKLMKGPCAERLGELHGDMQDLHEGLASTQKIWQDDVDALNIVSNIFKRIRKLIEPSNLSLLNGTVNDLPSLMLIDEVLKRGVDSNKVLAALKVCHKLGGAGIDLKTVFVDVDKIDDAIAHAIIEFNHERLGNLISSQEEYTKALYALRTLRGKIHEDDVLLDVVRGVRMMCRDLNSAIEKINFVPQFLEDAKVFELDAFETCCDFYNEGDTEGAREYILDLQRSSHKMTEPNPVDTEVRDGEGYWYMLKYVYPSGDYSTHEENIEGSDDQELQYNTNSQGYESTLDGILGYRTKEGVVEDTEALAAYSKRMEQIAHKARTFPDEEKQRRYQYTELVQKYMSNSVHEMFAFAQPVSAEGMLRVLLYSEAVKRVEAKIKNKKTDPTSEILDLIPLYKFALHENINRFVRESADQVEKKEGVEQRRELWMHVAGVYGENAKHILRHNIFNEEYAQEDRVLFEKIQKTYDDFLRDIQTGEANNAVEKIKNDLDAPGIPEERRQAMATIKLKKFAFSNMKFENKEREEAFASACASILEKGLGDKDREEALERVAEKLEVLRKSERFSFGSQLQEIFSFDSNNITGELAKYEPIIEEEMHEVEINGPRDKKVKKGQKTRKIRSFFAKTKETSNARMGAFLCIADDESMYSNEKYFELIHRDEETMRCIGVTMLVEHEDLSTGKKYLWFGPNPYQGFVERVSSKKCLDAIFDIVKEFAQNNGFDGIVIPEEEGRILGECTNRGGDFPSLILSKRLRDSEGRVEVVGFEEELYLAKKYSYKSGSLIWKNGA